MNVMLQNHTFYPALGGIENYLYHVSKILKEMGHQPIILCEKHDPSLSEFEIFDGIAVIRHPYYHVPKKWLLMKPKILFERLRDFISQHVDGVDLIISRYAHYCFATCSLNLDIPVFYIPPSVFWRQQKRASSNSPLKVKFFNLVWKRWLDSFERESLLKSKRVVVFSKNMEESLEQYYGLKELEFHVIPPGVNVRKFTRPKDLGLREELNLNEKDIVLLYVGRLSPEKNVEKVIREFEVIRRNGIKFLIVGYGSEKSRLEKIRDASQLNKGILFLGPRTDVERFYSIADIFISPSKHEPFGQVILEAMAAGLPCIAFKRVSPEYEVASEEIIEDGVTGFCVNAYNKDEFRKKLQFLIDNADIREKMGEAGRKACERKFTWDGHVRRLLELVIN
jgi:glycosyltransferase involved in cell wall biosynthesis